MGNCLFAQSVPEEREKFHIFLLMGQSNMEGGAAAGGSPDLETHPRILKLNRNNDWELAKDPLSNRLNRGVGPGFSFAKQLVQEDDSITVGLIPLAVGSTKIAQWSKGSELYQQVLSTVSYARNFGVIKGILWHQGEHDGIEVVEAYAYRRALRDLINDIRIDLQDVEIPFIAGGFTEGSLTTAHRHISVVWDATKAVTQDDYLTGYVPTKDLDYSPVDRIHFTVDAQRLLGQRYADKYLELSGHWTTKFRMLLDSESVEMEGGWKFNPHFGLYYDEHFPLIKHAQLNWLVLSGHSDGSVTMRSWFFGNLRTTPNPPRNGLYLYRESSDPEFPEAIGDVFYVNLLADPGSPDSFYNHTTKSWSSVIENLPIYDSIWDINRATETVFLKTQELSIETINRSFGGSWNSVHKNLKRTDETRLITIMIAQEQYWYAHENFTGAARDWWKQHSLGFLGRIDMPLLSAQTQYVRFVEDVVLSNR